MKFLGIIPARGGSKGILRKNLAEVFGHPLIYHTIQAAKDSELLTDFIVTSDSQEILDYCFLQNVELLRKRPDHLATDIAATKDVVVDVLNFIKDIKGNYPENIFMLQPTSPVRNGELLDNAIRMFEDLSLNSLVGVSPMTEHPFECVRDDGINWSFLEKPQQEMTRRQDYADNFYFINGSVYICKTSWFLENKKFVKEGETKLFVMEKEYGVDVDERYDLFRAEAAFNYIKHKE